MQPSTFSIVAYDSTETAWGIAVASKFLAVGAVVPWARAGAGAIATQSYANTAYAPRALEMMETGAPAEEVLQALISADPQSELRQVGLVDRTGGSATFTGKSCYDWAGGVAGPGYAIQGNILAGAGVVQTMLQAYTANSDTPLYWRLHGALLAGDRAGGDRRGRQSAAILVVQPGAGYGGFNDVWVDYRVDDHPDPVLRLGELLSLHDLYFGKSSAEQQVLLIDEPLRRFQALLTRLGYYRGPKDGIYSPDTRSALEAFIGNENFEERIDFSTGRIDFPVFDYLLNKFEASS